MLSRLRKGLDPAILFYFFHKSWMLFSTPVTIALVLLLMSKEEQGYYYTMLSIAAFQTLAELGFNAGLTHFVSHEWALLKVEGGTVVGTLESRSRMRSLLRIAARWTIISSVILILTLSLGGRFFLSSNSSVNTVNWLLPWWCLCASLIPVSMSMTLRSLAEGTDSVALSQRTAVLSSVIGNLVGWGALALGAKLYVLPIVSGIGALVAIVVLSKELKPILRLYFFHWTDSQISWKNDFLPHQLRLAVSWICGLLMFQSFVPFIFHYRGAIEAGQAGILLQGYALVNALGLAWVVTSTAKFGKAWATQDFVTLRRLTKATIRRSLVTVVLAAISGIAVFAAGKALFPQFASRFGSIEALAILLVLCAVMQSANAWTAAVRFSRREPFMWNSLVGSFLVIMATYILAPRGVEMIFVGYFLVMTVVVVPWVYFIYARELNLAVANSPSF